MKVNVKRSAFFVLILLGSCSSFHLLAQEDLAVGPDTLCVEKDLPDVIRQMRNKPSISKETPNSSLLLLPVIGSNPATGFMLGVGGQYAFKTRDSKQYSMLSGSMQFTTKQQFLFMLKNNVYTRYDRIFLSGDWRFQIFSQSTYGLGTNSPVGGIIDYQYGLAGIETNSDSLAQPMTFNFARLHQSVGFKVARGMYLGLGYQYDLYYKIVDQKLNLGGPDSLLTSHYYYSQYYGFDPNQYSVSGINASFIIDKRDNMVNAYKGHYLSVNYRLGFTNLNIGKNSNLLQLEWRSFHPLSKRNPTHLIAFWLMGDFVEEGRIPYMILPATAYDQRGRSARGYTQGRFRGNEFVYGEAEYRFPISPCGGVVGGVLFVNATTTNNQGLDLKLFDSIKPSYGFGFRFKVDKYSRTNLAADFGFGHQSFGFYLAASETF